MNEFEICVAPFTLRLTYCPFCGAPCPHSLRGSLFVQADDAERARLDALTAAVTNEDEMRAKFGAPDWDHWTVTFRKFSASANVVAMFRDGKAGVILMPRANPAAPNPKTKRAFDFVDGRPVPASDESGERGIKCTCKNLQDCVARGMSFLHFEEGRFELRVPGWSKSIHHCWFCGGEAPTELGVPRYLYPSAEEEARIRAISADVKTPEDAINLFGPSHRITRTFRYYELSPTAHVEWRISGGEWKGPIYGSKYIGPKEG